MRTKRNITTNLKTINNQNCPKIKLHGTLTTKELKKHSSRWVGEVETGSQEERSHGTVVDLEGKAGLADGETKDSKSLAVKYCGNSEGERNS